MPIAFDYIVAELPCPCCGRVTPADSSTEMTTRLRDEPSLAYLTVGDELPTDPARARESGYLVLREPTPGEDVLLLQTWECPACQTPFLWARVTVHDGVIAAIEPVQFADAVTSSHYVDDDAREVAADLVGRATSLGMSDDEAVAILRDRFGGTRSRAGA